MNISKSDLYLIRSDEGNGGWSLHLKGTTDYEDIAPTLASGVSVWCDDTNDWSDPTPTDYQEAIEEAKKLRSAAA